MVGIFCFLLKIHPCRQRVRRLPLLFLGRDGGCAIALLRTVAAESGMNYQGRPIHFDLVDDWGYPIPQEDLYVPHFRANCETCGSKLICNGCSDCGKCL